MMSLDKRYWLQVWWVLTWQYRPGTPLRKKIPWLLWAILMFVVYPPYIVIRGISWIFEHLTMAADRASDWCWGIINDAMPKERGNSGCPNS